MTDEQKAAYVVAQSVCAIAEIVGMQAENQQRMHRGESLAYVEQQFNDVIARNCISHNQVLSLFHGY